MVGDSHARATIDEAHEAVMTEVLGEPARLLRTGLCLVELPVDKAHRAEVVVAAEQGGDRVCLGCDRDALRDLLETCPVSDRRTRGTEAGEGLRAKVVVPELRRQPQRLSAGLERRLVFVREHLVARHLTENGDLDARRRSVCNERTRIFERRDRLATSPLLPEDVRDHECRLRSRLTIPAREQSVARLCKLQLPLLPPEVEHPPESEQEVRLVGISRISERQRFPEVVFGLRQRVERQRAVTRFA